MQKSDDGTIVEKTHKYISVAYDCNDYRFGPADEFTAEIIAGPDRIVLDMEQMEWLIETLQEIVEMVKSRESDKHEDEEGDIIY